MDVMDKILYGTLSAIFKHHKDRIQDESNQDRIKWKKAQQRQHSVRRMFSSISFSLF